MADRSTTRISSRKQPKQARSSELVSTILEAAVQVLTTEGAARFTTARVAEKAGVSGRLALPVFSEQGGYSIPTAKRQWRQAGDQWKVILGDAAKPPLERLKHLVHAFIRSECDEAAIRVALDDAAPLYRDAPEAREARAEGDRTIEAFMREALSSATDETRERAGELIFTTLSAVGKSFSETPPTTVEIEKYAEAMASMFCALSQESGP